jgi:hypothetical protein
MNNSIKILIDNVDVIEFKTNQVVVDQLNSLDEKEWMNMLMSVIKEKNKKQLNREKMERFIDFLIKNPTFDS